jgi:hypothetical protein
MKTKGFVYGILFQPKFPYWRCSIVERIIKESLISKVLGFLICKDSGIGFLHFGVTVRKVISSHLK